ncbi:MAG: ABC transporter ATP-binding protein [Deltaproteobacteria bacterium]|jgi:ABC-type lipoprotein export system ATPase subunit|nr:ABC transporter ATP-binding protein [Deltaproteobacteria bacterium]
MIRLRDLNFEYGDGGFSLRVPEFSVERGERIAIVGPSGSGKTTLLHLMSGIVLPQRGCVEIGGADWLALAEAERRALRIRKIGLVFQTFELLEYLRVFDNILLPYRIHRSLRLESTCRARAAELAEQMGVGDQLERYPTQLSQGERQRVAVCRALVTEPDLILADEPTGNLDPANKRRVLERLIACAERRNATLVLVTHDRDLLDRFERVVDVKAFSGTGSP